MDAVSGTQASTPLRIDFDAEAKTAYAKLGSIGGDVKATAVAEVAKVQGTFDLLNGLAKKSGFAEQSLKDGVASFVRARAAEAARVILSKHPNAAEMGADALAKATTAIILQGVIADLSRAAEADKVFGGFKGANDAFIAGLKAAFAQPLETAYGEIEVTVPPLQLPPQPEPPTGGSVGETKAETSAASAEVVNSGTVVSAETPAPVAEPGAERKPD